MQLDFKPTKTTKSILVNFRINEDLLKRFDEVLKSKGFKSRSDFVLQCIEGYVRECLAVTVKGDSAVDDMEL